MFGRGGILQGLVRMFRPSGEFAGTAPYPKRVWADFNGLFRSGKILCLSHKNTSIDEDGNTVKLHRGMHLTAFMEDEDGDGKRDDLIASGIVEASPEWLRCRGSKWILVIDENGVSHESELRNAAESSG